MRSLIRELILGRNMNSKKTKLSPRAGIWTIRWKRFKSSRLGVAALVLFTGIFLASLFAEFISNERPLLVVYRRDFYFPIFCSYTEKDFGGALAGTISFQDPAVREWLEEEGWSLRTPLGFSGDTLKRGHPEVVFPSRPDGENILGTDENGRDILATLLYGFRISAVFGFMLTAASLSLGIFFGSLLGFCGGWADLLGQRFMEILGGFPVTYLIIVLGSFMVPSFWVLMGIMLLFGWMGPANLMRTEFLKARKQSYVMAVKTLGVGDAGIIFRHILPNALVSTLAFLPFMLAGSITILTSLDFLGVGLPSEYPALGSLLAQGKNHLFAPWIGLSAFGFLSLVLVLLMFIGDALRDAFDPHASGKGDSI